jgi:S-adenosylmethionine:tRNA ribosyltransferase-isomerase
MRRNPASGASLKRSDFHFELPAELIAQQPLKRRSDSRLLQLSLDEGRLSDRMFRDLPALLRKGDLLVFNDTLVIQARLFARKDTGGKVEIMLERLLSDSDCLAQLRVSKPPRAGDALIMEDGSKLEVQDRQDAFFHLVRPGGGLAGLLRELGHVPLPPYIARADTANDRERYQTVYARNPGAVAAPTAGLHFDRELLVALDRQGVGRVEVTLHVGAGTFQPLRVENIEEHHMHAEYLEVSEQVCESVEQTRQRGGRVIAVGTTSVRSLETAASSGKPEPFAGESRIFIYPGYEFKVIDGLITNFHLPESTLLMLVSALAGMEETRAAYRHAVEGRYRFFSYGDAMLVL